jgi:two-component system NarL family sensor kinase
MLQESSSIIGTIVIGTIIVLCLVIYLFLFLVFFSKKQTQNKIDEANLRSRYEKEILKSQIETQNITMQKIGENLHDNIGQLLTVVKLNVHLLEGILLDEPAQNIILQTENILDHSIHELRSITKSLDHTFIENFGLYESVVNELNRLSMTGRLETSLKVDGDKRYLEKEKEIVLFRITQELINNSLKHSKATKISIGLAYQPHSFTLHFEDNGVGFDFESILTANFESSGAGLRNVMRRAKLLDADCTISSKIGEGTRVLIHLPIEI